MADKFCEHRPKSMRLFQEVNTLAMEFAHSKILQSKAHQKLEEIRNFYREFVWLGREPGYDQVIVILFQMMVQSGQMFIDNGLTYQESINNENRVNEVDEVIRNTPQGKYLNDSIVRVIKLTKEFFGEEYLGEN